MATVLDKDGYMSNRAFFIFCALAIVTAPSWAHATSKSKKIIVNLNESGIEDVDLLDNEGTLYPGTQTGNKIKFSVSSKKLNGASIIAFYDGQLVGSVGVTKNEKLRFRLKGKPRNKKKVLLSKVIVKLNAWDVGTPYVTATANGKVFSGNGSVLLSNIRNLGLNPVSNSTSNKKFIKPLSISGVALDSDGDAIHDLYDVDVDGDGIIDIADSNIETEELGVKALDSQTELPFTTLYLDISETVNWHINGALEQSAIDNVIGGENNFAIAYFFSFANDDPLASQIIGAYAVCPDELIYCRSSSVGASTGVYSGFSEGDSNLIGQQWSSLTASGHENSLENLPGGATWAASIQPRVGTGGFRPGDTYRVDFVDSGDNVVARKSLTLPPYFLTVPAVRAYNTTDSDAGNDVLIDYDDLGSTGMSNQSPIVLPSSGDFSGKLRLGVWRLQRSAVSGLESGDYRDFGHLNYGVLIENNTAEYTCGEFYESLSSTLTELPSAGSGNSFKSSEGALLWPLVDSADDYEPSSATDTTTVGDNTISFTVDLASCLDRNGLSAGTHKVVITAAGADTGRGANRAAQTIYVTIP